jgi:hypothetical protein
MARHANSMEIFSSSSRSYSSSDELYKMHKMTSLLLVVKKTLAKNVGASVAAHTLLEFHRTPRVRHVKLARGGHGRRWSTGLIRGGRRGVESILRRRGTCTRRWRRRWRRRLSVHHGGALGSGKRSRGGRQIYGAAAYGGEIAWRQHGWGERGCGRGVNVPAFGPFARLSIDRSRCSRRLKFSARIGQNTRRTNFFIAQIRIEHLPKLSPSAVIISRMRDSATIEYALIVHDTSLAVDKLVVLLY